MFLTEYTECTDFFSLRDFSSPTDSTDWKDFLPSGFNDLLSCCARIALQICTDFTPSELLFLTELFFSLTEFSFSLTECTECTDFFSLCDFSSPTDCTDWKDFLPSGFNDSLSCCTRVALEISTDFNAGEVTASSVLSVSSVWDIFFVRDKSSERAFVSNFSDALSSSISTTRPYLLVNISATRFRSQIFSAPSSNWVVAHWAPVLGPVWPAVRIIIKCIEYSV